MAIIVEFETHFSEKHMLAGIPPVKDKIPFPTLSSAKRWIRASSMWHKPIAGSGLVCKVATRVLKQQDDGTVVEIDRLLWRA